MTNVTNKMVEYQYQSAVIGTPLILKREAQCLTEDTALPVSKGEKK